MIQPKIALRVLAISCFAIFCAFPATSFAPVSSAQTADEIVAKVITARGGLEKIRAIRTQKVHGTISFGPGAEGPFSVEFERPGKMHMEMSVADKQIVRVYDGKSAGWVINPFSPNKDVQPMAADELRGISDESDFDGPLVDYQSKGNHLELAGKDAVEGHQVYKLKLTNKNGDVRTYFFDAETYLLRKWEGQRQAEDQVIAVETFFRDYREQDGLQFAFEIDSDSPGLEQKQKITIDKIELNLAVDEASFRQPVAPAPLTDAPATTSTPPSGPTPGVPAGDNPPATPDTPPAQPPTDPQPAPPPQ